MVITAFYAFTAWAITTQKVLDSRHLFRTCLRIGLWIGAIAGIILLALEIKADLLPRAVVVILCATAITLVFDQFNLRVVKATLLGGDREGDGVRRTVQAAGGEELTATFS